MSVSKNVADMRKAASAAFGQKNYEEAIKIYSEALLMSSITKKEMALLHSSRSKAYLFSADNNSENSQTCIELALQDANAAIQIQPEWWIGYSQVGLVYRHQKEWVKALEQFKMALDRDETQDSVKKYQSECRFYKKRAEMSNNFMLHQLEGEIAATDHLYNSTFDVRDILEQYEILELSDKPKVRLDSCAFFGVRYVKGINVPKDIPRGIKLLNEAVRGHSLQAMVELAILHIQGIGVEKDFKRAFNLLESVAIRDVYDDKSMGDYCIARAKFLIGLCYQDGTGKPQDYRKARGWYELAHKTGHAGATNNLAVFCEQGLGGEKDSTRANDLFWISAKRGNPVAMESLAWKYLWEKDEQQAEGWFLKALEMGNPSSIKNKDQFCKLLQNLRVILEEVDSPLGAAFFNPVNPEKLIEVEDLGVRNDMQIVVRIESAANTVVTKYWKCYDEIKIRAANGFPFAQTLLTAMNSIAQCLNYYHHTSKAEHSPTIINFAKEQCIRCFANSLRATEVVGFLQPQTVTVIYQYCMDTVNARTEIAWKREASIVACYLLLATRSSNFRSFAERCLETYHDEPFLYQILAAHKALHGEYEGALKLYDDGLQLFPDDSCLRYRKADVLKCIGSSSDILNKAFKEYITIAPFDDRMIPEAYYTLALHSTAREGEFYNRIGMEAESNMLPCFLPYRSDTKVYVASLNEKQDDKVKPGRLSTVLNHRRELKKMSQINRTGDASHATFGNTLQLSTRPDNFEEMTLQNMKPNEDMTYDHCFINLTICEDPIIDLLQSVRSVVVRDKNDDYMKCSLYNVDRHDQTVRENFIYGSKITIVNPHYHLPSDCSTSDPVPSSSSASNDVGFLKVDDPKLIIYRENGKDNLICRYCWRYYPELVCSKCKRSRYCCKDCQMSDWKILKHKLVCGVKHLDG